MKITDTFDYTNKFDNTYRNCHFTVGRYGNGNLVLEIVQETEYGDDLICTCSVNGRRLNGAWEIGIKDYSENYGILDFLKGKGIIGDLVAEENSGFVTIPYFKLTESGKELYKELLDRELCRK